MNLLLNGLDNDVIFNVLEVSKSIGDLLLVFMFGLVSELAEGFTSRNVFPLEVLGEGARVLLTAAARGSQEEHSLHGRLG